MKTFIKIFTCLLCLNSFSQTIPIQDLNFEKTLIDLGIDSDNTVNGQVLSADISQVTHLDLSTSNHLPIKTLDTWHNSHLDGFTSLKVLNISGIGYINIVDGRPWLDLSELTNLEELYFSNQSNQANSNINHLELLFLNNNPNLTKLENTDTGLFSAIDLTGSDLNNLNLIIDLSSSSTHQNCCRDICINVTNPTDAQNNQALYSSWTVTYTNNTGNSFGFSNTCDLNYDLSVISNSIAKAAIYPNPASEYFQIQTDNQLIDKVQIYTLEGKLVKQFLEQELYHISDIPSGLHFITIHSSNKKFRKKIIIE